MNWQCPNSGAGGKGENFCPTSEAGGPFIWGGYYDSSEVDIENFVIAAPGPRIESTFHCDKNQLLQISLFPGLSASPYAVNINSALSEDNFPLI